MFHVLYKKILMVMFSTIILGSLLTGCMAKDQKVYSDEPKVLRIMAGWPDEEQSVRQGWTDQYELTHANVEVEITPLYQVESQVKPGEEQQEQEDQYEKIKRILQENPSPDVIQVENQQILSKLVKDGLVQPLNTLMVKKKFQIKDLVPAVREGIKSLGDGKEMYALAPSFYSQALFYNKDLFEQYGIPYPEDHMTWDQIIELAQQFPKGEGDNYLFGLWTNNQGDFYSFLSNFAAPLGVQLIDQTGKKLMVDTPEWELALTKYMDLYKEGVFLLSPEYKENQPTLNDETYWDAFIKGKAAMAILRTYDVTSINDRRVDDSTLPTFAWDIVTEPTFVEAPGIGNPINFSTLMAINRNSQNIDLAWDYISFQNSNRVLKLKSRMADHLISNEKLILETRPASSPSNIQAFYTLTPAMDVLNFYNIQNVEELFPIIDEVFNKMLKGEKSIKEGLAEIQKRGQEVLDKPGKKSP